MLLRPYKPDGEILGNEMAIGKHDHKVHFKLDLEGACGYCGASEQARKYHEQWDHQLMAYIPVGNLNVLNFRSFIGK